MSEDFQTGLIAGMFFMIFLRGVEEGIFRVISYWRRKK